MKIYRGQATCDLCHGTCHDWSEPLIVKSGLRSIKAVRSIACLRCLRSREFFYVDGQHAVKFNEIHRESSGSILEGAEGGKK